MCAYIGVCVMSISIYSFTAQIYYIYMLHISVWRYALVNMFLYILISSGQM